MSQQLCEAMRAYAKVKQEQRDADAVASEVSGRVQAAAEAVLARADEAGVTKLPELSDTPKITIAEVSYAKCLDADALRTWLTSLDAEQDIATHQSMLTVNAQRLSSFVRERQEAGQEVPAFVKLTKTRQLRMGKE